MHPLPLCWQVKILSLETYLDMGLKDTCQRGDEIRQMV